MPQPLTPGQPIKGELQIADCESRYRTGTGRFNADRHQFTGKAGQLVTATATATRLLRHSCIFPTATAFCWRVAHSGCL
ncbi:MAG: hypothetical protein U0Y68_02500 [Blastocatellia bacterium]